MRFGLCVTPFTPGPGEGVEAYLRLSRAAREAGFVSIAAGESPLAHPHWTPPTVPLLARLAAATPELRMITSIVQPALHNPAMLADELVLLDHVADGGLVVGVGLGWRQAGFDLAGVPKAEAVRRFEDNVRLMRALWSGEPVSFDSDYCRLHGARLAVAPRQPSGPPIWFAANKDAAVRRAARWGDAWILSPHSTLDTLRRQRELFLEHRQEHGLPAPAEQPIRRDAILARDRATARDDARRHLGPLYESLVAWGHDDSMPAGSSLRLPFPELARDRFLIGTPAEVVDEIRTYESRLGVSEMLIRLAFPGMTTSDVERRIHEFGERVIAPMSNEGGTVHAG